MNPAPSAFSFFGGPKDTAAKDTSKEKNSSSVPATTSAPFFSLTPAAASKDTEKPQDATKTTTATTAPTPAAATSTAISVPPPSTLRGKTVEEIVNRWSSDLETHVKEFNKFAGEVAVWDRALIENGNNLAALYNLVLAAEREQSDIDQSLYHIEQQLMELSLTLDAYETLTEEMLGGQGGSLRALDTAPADTERDKNYMLATDLHAQLYDLSGSLTQMINSVNSLSLAPGQTSESASQGEDPMVQIAQILSSHLESLQWIDNAAREVEGKVTEVEGRVKDAGVGSSLTGSISKPKGFGLNRG